MKEKKTYEELKEEYKKEYERVIDEMDYFSEFGNGIVNGEIDIFTDLIREFEVPLPPRYLIDKKLRTKTYIIRTTGSIYSEDDKRIIPKPSCLHLHKGDVRKKNKKIESLFKCLSHFIPERLLNDVFYSCFVDNDKVIKKLVRYDERKMIKEREEMDKFIKKHF
jgi:hypothetical protein